MRMASRSGRIHMYLQNRMMTFKRSIANIITGIRIAGSVVLLFCPVFSPVFYVLYILAGVSDMIDGAVARKTGTVSEFGSKLDTVADIVFAAVCLIKVLPVIDIPIWIYIWIAIITFIKVANIAAGYIRQREFIPVHSIINKVTGAMLFAFPLTLTFIDLRYSASVVCMAATAAAIQEGYLINRNMMNSTRPLPE